MAVLRPKSSGQFRGLVGVRNQESGYPIGSYRQDLEAVDTGEIRGVVGEQRNVKGQRCGGHPGIGHFDRFPFTPSPGPNVRPKPTQELVGIIHFISCQVTRQLALPSSTPAPFECPGVKSASVIKAIRGSWPIKCRL